MNAKLTKLEDHFLKLWQSARDKIEECAHALLRLYKADPKCLPRLTVRLAVPIDTLHRLIDLAEGRCIKDLVTCADGKAVRALQLSVDDQRVLCQKGADVVVNGSARLPVIRKLKFHELNHSQVTKLIKLPETGKGHARILTTAEQFKNLELNKTRRIAKETVSYKFQGEHLCITAGRGKLHFPTLRKEFDAHRARQTTAQAKRRGAAETVRSGKAGSK